MSVVERALGSDEPGTAHVLEPGAGGYHSGLVATMRAGSLYSFRLDDHPKLLPDPASRFQPEGPHGPSQVVDPLAYRWRDQGFDGIARAPHVIYECHIGTFTKAGTYLAAAEQLPELARLGITILELMPVADFSGRFGWGYDGVDLYAPTRLYGNPDELRRFVDEAHALGISVILDVVYNHLGPDGNYLAQFSPDYFSRRYENEWGDPINFDAENSQSVREFFVQNARYWVEEYHLDGLRLDATQSLFDSSEVHVISEVIAATRAAGEALGKHVFIVSENEPQDSAIVRRRESGGYDGDALWNDDFHHSARVALTGRHEAYYSDYRGSAQELISALKWGYLYQGQHYFWQKQCRGKAALDLGACHFVSYLQNHDQIANSATGGRIQTLASLDAVRAMTVLLLLAPSTPMLFQGQEFAASSPFFYFADNGDPKLAQQVNRDRRNFLAQFPSIADDEVAAGLADASDPRTFERSKLDFSERESHREMYALHEDLLRLRREDPAFRRCDRDKLHGATLSERALLLRYFCEDGDRLLLCNLDNDLELRPAPEPLLAPPAGCTWLPLLSSDSPRYGGRGSGKVYDSGIWTVPARSAQVFVAKKLAVSDRSEERK